MVFFLPVRFAAFIVGLILMDCIGFHGRTEMTAIYILVKIRRTDFLKTEKVK